MSCIKCEYILKTKHLFVNKLYLGFFSKPSKIQIDEVQVTC